MTVTEPAHDAPPVELVDLTIDGVEVSVPKGTLVIRAAEQYGVDLKQSYLAGDRWRDIDAGASAG